MKDNNVLMAVLFAPFAVLLVLYSCHDPVCDSGEKVSCTCDNGQKGVKICFHSEFLQCICHDESSIDVENSDPDAGIFVEDMFSEGDEVEDIHVEVGEEHSGEQGDIQREDLNGEPCEDAPCRRVGFLECVDDKHAWSCEQTSEGCLQRKKISCASGKQCVNSLEGCKECRPGLTHDCHTQSLDTLLFPPCKKGVQICLPTGTWSKSCDDEVKPEKELCDGIDNNCNGKVDETFQLGRICNTVRQTDECVLSGLIVCSHPNGITCKVDQNSISPNAKEICNTYDDNCNGAIDEGFPNLNQECINTNGYCGQVGGIKGKISCRPDNYGTICKPLTEPPKEICKDNIDNNCDGNVDESWLCP